MDGVMSTIKKYFKEIVVGLLLVVVTCGLYLVFKSRKD